MSVAVPASRDAERDELAAPLLDRHPRTWSGGACWRSGRDWATPASPTAATAKT